MDLMNSRFKLNFRRGPKEKQNSSPAPNPVAPSASPTSAPSRRSDSTTSLSMNQQPQPQTQLGRPPSYTVNQRPNSPMAPGQQHGQHPAPLNPPPLQYPQPLQQMNPPGYGMQPMAPSIPTSMPQPYAGRNPAVEIEGANRSKAQLIVGIDFGTTFSGVAFAFATNNEAREDIITEWPGAGTHTKQKVNHHPESATQPEY